MGGAPRFRAWGLAAVAMAALQVHGVHGAELLTICASINPPFVVQRNSSDSPCSGKACQGGLEELVGIEAELISSFVEESTAEYEVRVRMFEDRNTAALNTRFGNDNGGNESACDIAIGGYVQDTSVDQCTPAGCPGWDPSTGPWDPSLHLCCLDYSQPYLQGGLSIMTKEVIMRRGTSSVISALISQEVLNTITWMMMMLIASGHLMWFAERNDNKRMFPQKYLDGIDDAIWWSAATVTTVGYGDKVPVTSLGRIVGSLWMFSGVLILSIFSGTISASLTEAKLVTRHANSLTDLRGANVCTVSGFHWKLLSQYRDVAFKSRVARQSFADCVTDLQNGDVEAVMYERVPITYFMESEGQGKGLYVSPVLYRREHALVMREGSAFTPLINEYLLGYKQASMHLGAGARVAPFSSSLAFWLGGETELSLSHAKSGSFSLNGYDMEEETSINWLMFGVLAGLVGCYVLVHMYMYLYKWNAMRRFSKRRQRSSSSSSDSTGRLSSVSTQSLQEDGLDCQGEGGGGDEGGMGSGGKKVPPMEASPLLGGEGASRELKEAAATPGPRAVNSSLLRRSRSEIIPDARTPLERGHGDAHARGETPFKSPWRGGLKTPGGGQTPATVRRGRISRTMSNVGVAMGRQVEQLNKLLGQLSDTIKVPDTAAEEEGWLQRMQCVSPGGTGKAVAELQMRMSRQEMFLERHLDELKSLIVRASAGAAVPEPSPEMVEEYHEAVTPTRRPMTSYGASAGGSALRAGARLLRSPSAPQSMRQCNFDD